MRHHSIHDMTVNYTFVSALLPAVVTPQGSAIAPRYVSQNNFAPRRLLCHVDMHAPLFIHLRNGSFFLSSVVAALAPSLSCLVIIYGAYQAATVVTSCMPFDVNGQASRLHRLSVSSNLCEITHLIMCEVTHYDCVKSHKIPCVISLIYCVISHNRIMCDFTH